MACTTWSKSRLRNVRFIVVANRESYIHRWAGEKIDGVMSASGMRTALDPIMKAWDGVWIAHWSGDADRQVVDEREPCSRSSGQASLHCSSALFSFWRCHAEQED